MIIQITQNTRDNFGATTGFTIVELLIVTIVIAILASISIVAYSGMQRRADATAILETTNTIEKQLKLYTTTFAITSWPDENSMITDGFTPSDNPTIKLIYAHNSDFRSLSSVAPTTSKLGDAAWSYDRDDTDPQPKTECDHMDYGTNIVISGVEQAIAESIDSSADDGNLECGTWRYDRDESQLMYMLSATDKI